MAIGRVLFVRKYALLIGLLLMTALLLIIGQAAYLMSILTLIIETREIWAPILTGLGGLGTLILAMLYLRQHQVLQTQSETQQNQFEEMKRQADLQQQVTELQKRQTNIMVQQEEWMEAQHAPDIYIQSWRAVRDQIRLSLTNLGNGIARDLKINFRIVLPGTTSEYANEADFEIGGAVTLERDTDYDEVTANVLVPDANIHEFKAIMTTFWLPEEVNSEDIGVGSSINILPFSEAVDLLLSLDIDEVQYELLLQYEYIRREEETVELWSGVVELEEGMDFGNAVNNTTRDRCPTSAENVKPENHQDTNTGLI